jgi:hypothetical protein
MAATKITELPAASNAVVNDLMVIVKDTSGIPTTSKLTVNALAVSLTPLVQNIIPGTIVTGNSVTVTTDGTNPVSYFSYSIGSGRTGCCDIQLHARDANGNNVTGGHLLIVANTTNASITATTVDVGTDVIIFDHPPTIASNTVTLFVKRGTAVSSNVTIRFSATVY